MKPSDRLLTRLVQMGLPVPLEPRIVRTYAGHVQRAAGAWSWSVEPEAWEDWPGAPDDGGAFTGAGGVRLIAEPIRFRRSSGA